MIESGFRYWLSRDYAQAVAIIFDSDDKAHMFSVDVVKARDAFPDASLDKAIYTMATNLFNSKSCKL
jgi:hypothetical protein